MKKLLLLGSVAAVVPATKHGGTENVAYVQAKMLAKKGVSIILVAAVGSQAAFTEKLAQEKEAAQQILSHIEFVEIGGGTQVGNADGSIIEDPNLLESSRKLRLEMVYLARVQELMIARQKEYSAILNNMRGEAALLPLAKKLNKPFINVMHLPLFTELAELFRIYKTPLITLSNEQKKGFPNLTYLATIPNPVNTKMFTFSKQQENYVLYIATIGSHKNQKDAILAAKKAGVTLILAGKIRDQDYFDKEIKPHIDGKQVIFKGEIGFKDKLDLYQNAKAFLFPTNWPEPFGLVSVEAMSCGTPVIAYPNGGPKEVVKDGKTGFLVKNYQEMADAIIKIDQIDRKDVRTDVEQRFSEEVVGEKYFEIVKNYLT